MNCHWDKNRECKSDFLCDLCKYQPADDDKPHGKDAPKAIAWNCWNVTQRILTDKSTKTPLLHGVLEVEFKLGGTRSEV